MFMGHRATYMERMGSNQACRAAAEVAHWGAGPSTPALTAVPWLSTEKNSKKEPWNRQAPQVHEHQGKEKANRTHTQTIK